MRILAVSLSLLLLTTGCAQSPSFDVDGYRNLVSNQMQARAYRAAVASAKLREPLPVQGYRLPHQQRAARQTIAVRKGIVRWATGDPYSRVGQRGPKLENYSRDYFGMAMCKVDVSLVGGNEGMLNSCYALLPEEHRYTIQALEAQGLIVPDHTVRIVIPVYWY